MTEDYSLRMLRPVIFVGCGGSGFKTVARARQMVKEYLEDSGWVGEIPKAWQFLAIDAFSAHDLRWTDLPSECWIDISAHGGTYRDVDHSVIAATGNDSGFVHKDLLGWRPNPEEIDIPLPGPMGGYRGTDRMQGIATYSRIIQPRIENAFDQAIAGVPELVEFSRSIGTSALEEEYSPKPIVIVVGSIVGGVGSGIMLDIVDLIRQSHLNGAFPSLIGFTADVFVLQQNQRLAANAAAFMAELMATSWNREQLENPFIPFKVSTHRSGPHTTYLIGRKTLNGFDFQTPSAVFESVAQYLTLLTTSQDAQMDYMYQQVNAKQLAAENAGGYGFSNTECPGIVRSFGIAKISTGRRHFRRYIEKLLGRSIVERLVQNGISTPIDSDLPSKDESISTSEIEIQAKRVLESLGLGSINFEDGETFLKPDEMVGCLDSCKSHFSSALPSTENLTGEEWYFLLAQLGTNPNISYPAGTGFSWLLQDDVIDVATRIIDAVIERVAAQFGLSTSISVLQSLNVHISDLSSGVEALVQNWIRRSDLCLMEAQVQLLQLGKRRRVNQKSWAVQAAIDEISKSYVYKWGVERNLEIVETLRIRIMPLIQSLISEHQKCLQNLLRLSTPQIGYQEEIADWPNLDGGIPLHFRPLPNEFVMEEIGECLNLFLHLLPSIDGRDSELIRRIEDLVQNILVRRESNSETFVRRWTQNSFNSNCVVELVRSYLLSDELGLKHYFEESIVDFLSPNSNTLNLSGTTAQSRLEMRYFIPLNGGVTWASSPLISMNSTIGAVAHPKAVEVSIATYGASFPNEHPGHAFTAQILNSNRDVSINPISSSFENRTDSITFLSTIKYPVHPGVIRNFTEPFTAALSAVTDEPSMSSHLWRWSRSRTLTEFIPLSEEMRLAAIRGFALARITGAMSISVSEPCRISGPTGVFEFPRWTLTKADLVNVLPALLESMILTFSNIEESGTESFAAYRTLIEFGQHNYCYGDDLEFSDSVRNLFVEGDYGSIQIQDESRKDKFLNHPDGRVEAAREYMFANLEHFQRLANDAPPRRGWRSSMGRVDPDNTLTLELIHDLFRAYTQVLNALSSL
jgi:hypothetical protein